MKARSLLFHHSFVILGLALPIIMAINPVDTEVESVTGTREPDDITTTETSYPVATTTQSNRQSRWYRPSERGGHDDHEMVPDYHEDHHEMEESDMKGKNSGNADYFGGYYDFLINEGSYKFWAVFQLSTAALLIYSGFAALYYAKVNPPTDDDYSDYFLRRRRRRSLYRPPQETDFLGLSPEAFQRIIDALAKEFH